MVETCKKVLTEYAALVNLSLPYKPALELQANEGAPEEPEQEELPHSAKKQRTLKNN